ncbi:MAG: alpha/beta fold hydrolase [Pseudomonadota bacterium]
MRSSSIAALSALACAIAPVSVAAQEPESSQAKTVERLTPLPLEEYGELPDVEDAALSKSGNRVALITTIEGTRALIVIENQEKMITSVAVGDLKIRDIQWIGDDRILLVSSQTEDLGAYFTTDKAEFYIGRVIPVVEGAKAGMIFSNRRGLVDAIVGNYGIREIDGRYYGYYGGIRLKKNGRMEYTFDHGRPFLFQVDLQDFSVKRIANAARPGHDNDWLIDANGNIAATFDINAQNGNWTLRNNAGDTIAKGNNPLARIGLLGLGYGGETILLSERNEDGVRWLQIPMGGGELTEFLPDTGIERIYFDRQTGHLMGYRERGGSERVVFQDEAKAEALRKVRKAFSKFDTRPIAWTSDLSQMIVRTAGNRDSGTWFAVDVKNLRAHALAYERNAIGPQHVGPISTFAYAASDGLEMSGILTLPPGREPANLPVVVLPHGGPHARDRETFDWWAQAYASRGYAVFQPNFRGSTGRSDEFRMAGYGEWGRKMQTDKSDGLAALAEKGIVDPKRACIVGASYGGYAALAGVTLQQGIYRCAVAVAPVSDIKDMYQQDYRATGRERTTKAALLDQLGPRDTWDAVSPLRSAAKADAPIMLIHGRDDIVVPYSHSAKMADKLKDADKPHEMISLKGEDHWLSRSETRRRMLEAAVGFVEKHNPAD